MADTYESKQETRLERGTVTKIDGKYYTVAEPPTKAQEAAAAKLGMTLSNIGTVSSTTVQNKAQSVNESTLSLALQWLKSTRAIQSIEAARTLPVTSSPGYNYALQVRQGAEDAVRNIARIEVSLNTIRRRLQLDAAGALKDAYAVTKGYSSDAPYAEMLAVSRTELEWYMKTYGTEDPVRIEALKTLERRDNQGKTSYELAMEGKDVSNASIDALIAEIDETALTELVQLALQEEQHQLEAAREASERRNQILMYTVGGLGISAAAYYLFFRK
ncbi:MAG: hypothetical protein GWP42_14165 [Verrucomicrobiales bacterium]|nr:hypothetical protein [Verrucomicrobiales bacterium]